MKKKIFLGIFLILTIVGLITYIVGFGFINQREAHSYIDDIVWQDDEFLWVAECDQLTRWHIPDRQRETFADISATFLLVDSQNNLWAFDTNQVGRFDGQQWETFTRQETFIGSYIFSVAESNGYIWVGSMGLSRYNQQSGTWEFVLWPSFDTSSSSASAEVDIDYDALLPGVYTVTPDGGREGVWVGSDRGLFYIADDIQQTWKTKELGAEGVFCVLETAENELWVCTENGVGRWDGRQWHNFEELHAPLSLTQDHTGNSEDIWVVTRESGVARWNGAAWDNWTYYDGVIGLRPTSLVISSTGEVWVGSDHGISRWNGKTWQIYKTSEGLTSDRVRIVYEDPRGTLWAGTSDRGSNYYDPNMDQWRPFP